VVAQRLFWEETDASGTEAALRQVLRARAAVDAAPPPDADNALAPAGTVSVGSPVEAQWQTGRKWFGGAVVTAVHVDGSMAVQYADGDFWQHAPPHMVRRPGAAQPLAPPPFLPSFAAVTPSEGLMAAGSASTGEGGDGGGGELEEALRYDLVLGADLLFFESHAALAHTLDRLLKRHPTNSSSASGGGGVGGSESSSHGGCPATALLVQPSRNGTLERFCAHPDVTTRFRVEVLDGPTLCPKLAAAHALYQHDPAYSPTLHCPHLVRLTRLPPS
jgi:hypothetical protein